MKKVNAFNKVALVELREELNKVFKKFESKGIKLDVGNMRFDSAEVDIKVKGTVIGAKTRGNALVESIAKSRGFALENARGDKLVDYKTRSPKYPFVYVDGVDGKRYKCTEDSARSRFGGNA